MKLNLLLFLAAILLTACATTVHSRTTEFPNGAKVTEVNIYIAGGFVPPVGEMTFPLPRVRRFETGYEETW